MSATRGPWLAEPLELREGTDLHGIHAWEIRHREGPEECVCIAEVYSPGFSSDYRSQSEVDATAKLIAAAPMMLEALRAAEGHLAEDLKDERSHPIRECPVLNLVRAAIAEATGEA